MRKLLAGLTFVIALMASAQVRTEVDIYGRVTGHFDPRAESGVTVRVTGGQLAGGSPTVRTDRRGRYLFGLLPGFVYSIEYSKPGMVTKRLRVDTKGVPANQTDLYQMEVQLTMVDSIPGFDFSVFESPIAEAAYDRSIRNMGWDTEYTAKLAPTVALVMAEYDKVAGGYLRHDGATWAYVGKEDSVMCALNQRLTGDTCVKSLAPVRVSVTQVEILDAPYFCVQLGTYSGTMDTRAAFGLSDLEVEILDDSSLRYNYGRFSKEEDARQALSVVSRTVPGATVVAYFKGGMITLEEARTLLGR